MSALSAADTRPKMERMRIELMRGRPAWKKFAIIHGEWARSLNVTDLLERALQAAA
jgi:hypothetical protein